MFTALLTTLGSELNAIRGGHDILQRDPSDNKLHGYFDIFDASSNPNGYWGQLGGPAFPAITNEQFGGLLNFQLMVRDDSSGVHYPGYIMKLLRNTIEAI